MKTVIICVTLILVCTLGVYYSYERKPFKYEYSEDCTKVFDCFMHEMMEGASSWNLKQAQRKTQRVSGWNSNIRQGEEGPFTMGLWYTNTSLYGFKDGVVFKVKGFVKDTEIHEVAMMLEEVGMIADYFIDGMLLKPLISGAGKCNITFINSDLKIIFSSILLAQPGKNYIKIGNLRVHIVPERIMCNFSNLSDVEHIEIGEFENIDRGENGVRIALLKTLSNEFRDVFKHYITNVINNVFQKYAYQKYYDEK